MGPYRTLDAHVTIGCYYGDYIHMTTPFQRVLFIWNIFFHHTCLPSFLIIKVTASYCIASLIFLTLHNALYCSVFG